MKKFAKLLILPLLVFTLLFTAGQTKAQAAEEEMIIIYAQVPDDWSEPCLWAWNDDGTNAFEAWPGGQMSADAGNEGWYYCYVPSWVTNIIINANAGEVQTSDMKCNSKDSWVVIKAADDASLSNDKMTTADAPAYVEPVTEDATTAVAEETTAQTTENLITVHTQVPSDWQMPCLWAWSAPDGTNVFANWPGQELEQNGDWYEYQVPDWVNSIIVNGNLGDVQTSDISVEGKDVWIVVKAAGDFTVTYEEPSGDSAADETTVAPTTAEAEDENDDSDSNVGLIVGIVIAVVVVAGVIAAVVVTNKKKSE